LWQSLDLYYKYGNSPRDLRSLVQLTISKFQRIYNPEFFPFDSLTDLIARLGLEQELASTADALLNSRKVGVAAQKDLVTPWTRSAYGLNLGTINGLATMNLLNSGKGMDIPSIGMVLEEMVQKSAARVLLSETVSGLYKLPWGSWMVHSHDSSGRRLEHFDSVIVAAPLKVSGVEIQGEMVEDVSSEPDYVPVHVTLFASAEWLEPDYVLSTLTEEEFYNLGDQIGSGGVGKVGFYSLTPASALLDYSVEPPAWIYLNKIISPEEIKDSFLESLVGNSSNINFVKRLVVCPLRPHPRPQQNS
jgi:prenylcysteine oxidase/farnesylcysteine lyase